MHQFISCKYIHFIIQNNVEHNFYFYKLNSCLLTTHMHKYVCLYYNVCEHVSKQEYDMFHNYMLYFVCYYVLVRILNVFFPLLRVYSVISVIVVYIFCFKLILWLLWFNYSIIWQNDITWIFNWQDPFFFFFFQISLHNVSPMPLNHVENVITG